MQQFLEEQLLDLKWQFHLQTIQDGHLYVLISSGKSRFVDELHIPNVEHCRTSAEMLFEHANAEESEPCWRKRRLAQGNLLRPLLQVILAPGHWMRTLPAFLPAQCICTQETSRPVFTSASAFFCLFLRRFAPARCASFTSL